MKFNVWKKYRTFIYYKKNFSIIANIIIDIVSVTNKIKIYSTNSLIIKNRKKPYRVINILNTSKEKEHIRLT